jgi:hypothetical protein
MTDSSNATTVPTTPSSARSLPPEDTQVDFGQPVPGSSDPMPDDRRTAYENRIRNSVDQQAAGAEKASQLFIR